MVLLDCLGERERELAYLRDRDYDCALTIAAVDRSRPGWAASPVVEVAALGMSGKQLAAMVVAHCNIA